MEPKLLLRLSRAQTAAPVAVRAAWGWTMNAGEFGFVVFVWWSMQRFAMVAMNAAASGRSWIASLAIAGRDQLVWLAAR